MRGLAAGITVMAAVWTCGPALAQADRLVSAPRSAIAGPAGDDDAGSTSAAGHTIELPVGGQRQLAWGRALARVAVGDPAVADVLVLKGSGGVLLLGKAPGTTNVMLWERGHADARTYTVSVAPAAAGALLGPDTPKVRVLGDTGVISGSAADAYAHERAVAVAGAAAAPAMAGGDAKGGRGPRGEAVVDTSTIAVPGIVQVDVKVVEFSKQVLKEAGFNLFRDNNGFAFGTFAPSALQSVSGPFNGAMTYTQGVPISSAFNLVFHSISRGLFADLSLLEGNNLARVLAQPTLVALSGQSASFLAGGEIPVPVPQALGATSIVFKPYGVGLTLTPTVLSRDRIALKVAPEASQLDFTHAVTVNGISVPAITTRRADTTVELGDGESFVIGGLIDRETQSNVSKVPVLGDLPIIGTFFKSLNYQRLDKELVIIVTPHLVSPIAKGARAPTTPGEQSEQRDGPVWRSFVGGLLSDDAAPGFSR